MGKNPFSILWAELFRRFPNRRYLDLKDRHRRLLAQFYSLATAILGSAYLIWLGNLVLRRGGFQDSLFLAAETFSFVLLLLLGYDTWHLRAYPPDGLPAPERPPVDLFIPYCGEPLEVIHTTLKAVQHIAYQPLTVYVLDDAGSPAVAALARSLGFSYLSRVREGMPRRNAKSGNLNFGLSRSRGELILVLDADQVPDPEILTRLVGFFRRPRVCFAQSQQAFLLPQGDPFYNGDKIFYEVLQLSNDQANAVISCGSGVLYRRRALEAIGGFPTWNLLEDFTCSYELVSRGWKGIYYPYPLSRGLAPSTLGGVYRQRFQWCLDTMRLFFWDNPLFKSGLNGTQKIHFLIIMLSYLVSGLVFPVFYAIPLLAYWHGYSGLTGAEFSYWGLRGAYLLATILMFRYLFYRKEALKQFKMLCSLFPVYALGTLAALLYFPARKPAYRSNNLAPLADAGHWWHLTPHMGFIGLHVALPFVSLWLGWALPRLIFFNAIFSAVIIWVLGDLVLAVLTRPQWTPAMDPRRVYG